MKTKLNPNGIQKDFYGKAWVITEDGDERIFLKSYNTIVAFIYRGRLYRMWNDWSLTTSNHIKAFCREFGITAPNKAEWCAMEIVRR